MSAPRLRAVDPNEHGVPDPRFTFANERTFLAWSRTALALIGGGLAAGQILHGSGRFLVAAALLTLGTTLGLASYRRWCREERALRLGQPLPASFLPRALAYGVVAFAVIAAVVVAFR
jgi:putative membrane protein